MVSAQVASVCKLTKRKELLDVRYTITGLDKSLIERLIIRLYVLTNYTVSLKNEVNTCLRDRSLGIVA